jgi:hypothetical protein
MMRFFSLLLTLAFMLFLTACSTKRANTVEDSGFLGADLYSKMETNTQDDTRALRLYKSAHAKDPAYMKRFTKVLLNPIVVYLEDDKLEDVGHKNAQVIANQFYDKVSAELSKDYTMVTATGPDVLVITAAITNLENANPTMNAISTVVPFAAVTSSAYTYFSDEPSYQGQVAVEAKMMDGGTGEILVAAQDRRLGGKGVGEKTLSSWYDVEKALTFWAQATRRSLCELRGGTACIAPTIE